MLEGSSIEIKPGSERNFGFVFSAVFAALGFYPWLHSGQPRLWCLAIALLFLLTTLLRPALLARPNYWWFRFGLLLGAIIAPVVMSLVYITTILPIGLGLRLAGKDPLGVKLDKAAKSYWIKRETPPQSMKIQF
jgi:hypothetical protein